MVKIGNGVGVPTIGPHLYIMEDIVVMAVVRPKNVQSFQRKGPHPRHKQDYVTRACHKRKGG